MRFKHAIVSREYSSPAVQSKRLTAKLLPAHSVRGTHIQKRKSYAVYLLLWATCMHTSCQIQRYALLAANMKDPNRCSHKRPAAPASTNIPADTSYTIDHLLTYTVDQAGITAPCITPSKKTRVRPMHRNIIVQLARGASLPVTRYCDSFALSHHAKPSNARTVPPETAGSTSNAARCIGGNTQRSCIAHKPHELLAGWHCGAVTA
jgi:hypothetical protein